MRILISLFTLNSEQNKIKHKNQQHIYLLIKSHFRPIAAFVKNNLRFNSCFAFIFYGTQKFLYEIFLQIFLCFQCFCYMIFNFFFFSLTLCSPSIVIILISLQLSAWLFSNKIYKSVSIDYQVIFFSFTNIEAQKN